MNQTQEKTVNPYSQPKKVAKGLKRSLRRIKNLESSPRDFHRKAEFRKVDSTYLAPSLPEATIRSGFAIFKPASLGTFGLICLFGLYKSFLAIEEEVTKPPEAVLNQASFALEQEYVENLEKVATVSSGDQLKQGRQLAYITGLISMHLPNLNNGAEIARLIVSVAEELKTDPFYITAIISSESRFIRRARSHVGAVGLMQLMKPTARALYKEKTGKNLDPDRTQPRLNIELGTTYIKQLEKMYKGNRFNALAAYNWGPGNLNKAIRRGKRMPKGVRKYANGILEKTLKWRKHYLKAEQEILNL